MITEKEEIIRRIAKLERNLKRDSKKIDELIFEMQCMIKTFIKHYEMNRIMSHTKSVKLRTVDEHKKKIEKEVK